MSPSLIAALAIGLLPASPPNNSPVRENPVVVFRYHPGLLGPNREARLRDDDRILQALKDLKISHGCIGGCGRGFEVELWTKDLVRWKAAIDKMIEDGLLEYYRWGTDMRGYGLVPIK